MAENKGEMHASITSNSVYALWQTLQADNWEVIHIFLTQGFKHCTGASYIADGDRGEAWDSCSGYVHQNFRSTLEYRYPFPGISSDHTLTIWNDLVQGYARQHRLCTVAVTLLVSSWVYSGLNFVSVQLSVQWHTLVHMSRIFFTLLSQLRLTKQNTKG